MPPRWSAHEDRVLLRLYADGAPLRTIAERTGRSENAVAERRRTLGISPRARQRPWTPQEDDLLRAAGAFGLPAAAVAERLRRPADQVRRRRRALIGTGPSHRPFDAAEDARIVACWTGDGEIAALARALGRTTGSVRLRAQKLGAHRPANRPRWRADEDVAVRDGYEQGLACGQIAAGLPGRSPTAVAARAARLGVATYARAWTAREDRDLRRLARHGIGLERAAHRLGRTPEAVRARARKLGVPAPRSPRAGRAGRRWTPREDELLHLHGALNPAALAELLDRSPEAVTQRLRRLGLRQAAERSPHHPAPTRGGLTPGQQATIERELRTAGPRRRVALARRLGIRPAAIRAANVQAAG